MKEAVNEAAAEHGAGHNRGTDLREHPPDRRPVQHGRRRRAVQREQREAIGLRLVGRNQPERPIPKRQRDDDQNRGETGIEAEELHARLR